MDQARRLKQLETENGRLKRAVAELTLGRQILNPNPPMDGVRTLEGG